MNWERSKLAKIGRSKGMFDCGNISEGSASVFVIFALCTYRFHMQNFFSCVSPPSKHTIGHGTFDQKHVISENTIKHQLRPT